MIENNEEILFKNILEEPESTLAEDIILGACKDDICKEDTCTKDACPKDEVCIDDAQSMQTEYFVWCVGFELFIRGNYGQNLTTTNYNLPSARAYISTTGNYSFPLNMISNNNINAVLTASTTHDRIVWKSGVTSVQVYNNATSCTISGITVSTDGRISCVTCAGTITSVSALTHQCQTGLSFNYAIAIMRTNGSTPTSNECNDVKSQMETDAFNYITLTEKQIYLYTLESISRDAIKKSLQGSTIIITNGSGGVNSPVNEFRTGHNGYINLYTSGNTNSSFTVSIDREGYHSETFTGSYGIYPDDIHRNSYSVYLTPKTDHSIPTNEALSEYLLGSYNKLPSFFDNNQLATQSLYYISNTSAVTGSVTSLTNSTLQGNQILRYNDIASILPSPSFYTDEYRTGKLDIYTYTVTQQTFTGNGSNTVSSSTPFATITGIKLTEITRIQLPKFSFSASGEYHGFVIFYLIPSINSKLPGNVEIRVDSNNGSVMSFNSIYCTDSPTVITGTSNTTYSISMYIGTTASFGEIVGGSPVSRWVNITGGTYFYQKVPTNTATPEAPPQN